jgi:hypothetical protein
VEALQAQLDTLGLSPELQGLLVRAVASARVSKSTGTWLAYEPHIQRWLAFCAGNGVKPFQPAADGGLRVSLFLQKVKEEAAQRGVGPSVVSIASAAVSALHELVGLPSPSQHPLAAGIRAAAYKELVGAAREKPVATPEELRQLIDKHLLAGGDVPLKTRMYVTAAALSFTGLLRFSDLRRVLVHHQLLRFYPDRAEIFLYASKTDQQFRGELVSVGRGVAPYCPVALLEQLLQAGGYCQVPNTAVGSDGREVEVEDVGPLLRAVVQRSGRQQLRQVRAPLPALIPAVSYNTFANGLHALFADAGVERRLPPHSLRRGGATAAVNGGADRILVQKLGRWRSANVFEFTYVRDDGGRSREVTVCMGINPEEES